MLKSNHFLSFYRKLSIMLSAFFLAMTPNATAQLVTQKVYIDLGQTGSKITDADLNGNYWSNITSGTQGSVTQLTNSKNENSGLSATIATSGFFINGGTSNGGLASPSPDLLGDFAVEPVTLDYFYTNNSTILFSGFKVNREYRFYIYGTRSNTEIRINEYTLIGATSETLNLQSSGTNLSGSGENGNNCIVARTNPLKANANGEISLQIKKLVGTWGHISAIKIEELLPPDADGMTQRLYIDFGPNGDPETGIYGANGIITPSPDVNGNYWNNLYLSDENSQWALTNAANVTSGITATITKGMSKNGKTANGGIDNPAEALLKDLAISTATIDYFFAGKSSPGEITFSGLNKKKSYRFHLFGSRTNTEIRIANFLFTGGTREWLNYQTSGTNFGGSDINGNINTVGHTGYIVPDENGKITLSISALVGSYAHVSAMKIEEYDVATVLASDIIISGSNITENGQMSQMRAEIVPATATYQDIVWSIDNEKIASISSTGLIRPKGNGIVNVTATLKQEGEELIRSKSISIDHQLDKLYISGSATENGDNPSTAIPMMMVTDLNRTITSTYEIYTSLTSGGTFNFYTGCHPTDRLLKEDVKCETKGTVRITFDTNNQEVTILPISKWSVVGSTIQDGWSGDVPLAYQGDGKWSGRVDMTLTYSDSPRFLFRANGSWDYHLSRVKGTIDTLRLKSQGEKYGFTVEDIGRNTGIYDVTLDLRNYTYSIHCIDKESDRTIVVLGSSVAKGTGATNDQGYIYQYNQLLQARYPSISDKEWQLSNQSIGGSSTKDVLSRWANNLTVCDKYIIYGLSLGNEGIHGGKDPEAVYNQFSTNLQTLIEIARTQGSIPIISNNYTRADFTEEDYRYVKKINMLIHRLDVPSINLLGGIDDGFGRWVTEYRADNAHPNTEGHSELYYTLVPSLFDALDNQKPQPQRATGDGRILGDQKETVYFTPENILHSFTLSLDFKTTDSGNLLNIYNGTQKGCITLTEAGTLQYTSSSKGSLTSMATAIDGKWHNLALSHYYAQGATYLYLDGELVGKLPERISPTLFALNEKDVPAAISYRDWFVYRAGMNSEEIQSIVAGDMLKSSLELYAPLFPTGTNEQAYVNLAQSTNTLKVENILTGIQTFTVNDLIISPNPVLNELFILENDLKNAKYEVLGMVGIPILSGKYQPNEAINVSGLPNGIYILKLDNRMGKFIKKKLK